MFTLVKSLDVDEHIYRRYGPNSQDLGEWLLELAHMYVDLRSEFIVPPSEISFEGLEEFSTDDLEAIIQNANVPDPVGGNFDVLRSDLGELSLHLLLGSLFGTQFAYIGIRDRELVNLPGRGIDLIGVEAGTTMTLVIGEAKVSVENSSPPQVVDTSNDSLREQHLGHLGDIDTTISKVFVAAKQARNREICSMFLTAGMYALHDRLDKLKLSSSSLLVRCAAHCTDKDFGSFIDSPTDYSPSEVRFFLVAIPTAPSDLQDEWSDAVIRARGNNE